MIYIDLFVSFMIIGVMTFGGGYSILPLVEDLVIDKRAWLNTGELADIISISEMSPGPFSLNCSTFVGMKVAGLPGAITATFGLLLPSIVIVLILAYFYNKYHNLSGIRAVFRVLNACVIAVLLCTAFTLLQSSVLHSSLPNGKFDWLVLCIYAVSFFVLMKWKVNPIYLLLASAVLGMILYPIII